MAMLILDFNMRTFLSHTLLGYQGSKRILRTLGPLGLIRSHHSRSPDPPVEIGHESRTLDVTCAGVPRS